MSRSKIVCSLVVALALSACAKAPSYEGKWVPHSVECFPGSKPADKFEMQDAHAYTLTIKDDTVTTVLEKKSADSSFAPTVTQEKTFAITDSKEEKLTLRILNSKVTQGDSVDETDHTKSTEPTFYKGAFVEKDGKLTVRDFRSVKNWDGNIKGGVGPARKTAAANGRAGTFDDSGNVGSSMLAFEGLSFKNSDGTDARTPCVVDNSPAARTAALANGPATNNLGTAAKAYIYKKAE